MAIAKRKSPGKRVAATTGKKKPVVSGRKSARPLVGAALAKRKVQAAKVADHLRKDYPDVSCALENETPFELLIATILSAQCTDARVNMVTPELFRRWPDAAAMATAPQPALEKVIQSTGFFRMKAKNIKAASQALIENHAGEIPQDLEALVDLPGVGRKTANVVLGTAFGMATGVVVDTHVTRLSKRLGLTTHTDATKIEQDLMQVLPESEWVDFAHRMIHHGRAICVARKPRCPKCSMNVICPKIGVTEKSTKDRESRRPGDKEK